MSAKGTRFSAKARFRDQDLLDRVQRALEKGRVNRAQLRDKNRIHERRESLIPLERETLDLMTRAQQGHGRRLHAS